ncbi:LuxR family transcriptional regulator [Amycolatopsis albispora]|uniref:LuxR family transcriptional regulator n=2 Tax=Amycolatopsis albispora TaxID=1804986 RepID=A0A344LLS0_9PSEU|nr:DNA-binding response regulator [Amycolatopsis albispora]AXB48994.1 LuxR family transcriptional regulator [Amycolatopsis albispora]
MSATEVWCAAADLSTFAASRRTQEQLGGYRAKRVRKIYRPSLLLDHAASAHLDEVVRLGAEVRISADEINETIVLDRRVVILAGDRTAGDRAYSVLTAQETVQGVVSLFDAAWRGATDLAVYDARVAELRTLAPRILDMLASGCKDETAARSLGLGLRTYRRRVAELMDALGATSRFQAGVRAGELGLL